MKTNSRTLFGRASFTSVKQLTAPRGRVEPGLSLIEAQHAAISDVAMQIAQCWEAREGIDRLRRLTEKLELVLAVHFSREEQQLAAQGLPKLEERRAAHRALLGELHVIRRRLGTMDESNEGGPGFMLHKFVIDLAAAHISRSGLGDGELGRKQAGKAGQNRAATPPVRQLPLSSE